MLHKNRKVGLPCFNMHEIQLVKPDSMRKIDSAHPNHQAWFRDLLRAAGRKNEMKWEEGN